MCNDCCEPREKINKVLCGSACTRGQPNWTSSLHGKALNSCAESLTSSGWEAKSTVLIEKKKKCFLKANLSVQYTWKCSNILKQLAAY